MEREVFENDSIAALMNEYVVSIKVDREERPDVDRVYMLALQAMTGSGGWPMSMFLTSDLRPFYGATYLPPKADHGRPGFPEILTRIHEIWTTDRQQVEKIGQQMEQYLRELSRPEVQAIEAGKVGLERGFESFSASYDSIHSGFGGAPKFPLPVSLNFLFRYYSRTGEQKALFMALQTLKRMALGGIHDHLGGGFHRYSTDERWHVPHFEKMLYDQAQLATSYLEAYQITHDEFYSHVVRDILEYVSRDMTHTQGGFYSAEDAESAANPVRPEEKKEGAFYVWTKDEIDKILTREEARLFEYTYDVREGGNVVYDPHQAFVGKNILSVAHLPEETANTFDVSLEGVKAILGSARKKLSQVRDERPKPHLDDKILVSWNGLMISAFARAYQVLQEEEYLETAERAGEFILEQLYDPDRKRLLRRYRDGEARYEAHLEDYAFLVQGLLDLYEASLDIRWLTSAIELTDQQNRLFFDEEEGGFYDTSGRDESILIRSKESYDGAEPSGNSIAILNLLRLSQMIDSQEYRALTGRSLSYFGKRMLDQPQAMAQLLVALDFSLSKPKQIIVAGKPHDHRKQNHSTRRWR